MQEDEFNLDAYLASKGSLDHDPELGRRTVTLVPGCPGKDTLEKADVRDLLFPDLLVDDVLFDDAPSHVYPLIPPLVFGWNDISERKRAQTAAAILGADIRYDEQHALAGQGDDFDPIWSRVMAWYLITALAGDARIEARLRKPEATIPVLDTLALLDSDGFSTIEASELAPAEVRAMGALRLAYMSNFKVIVAPIIREHMPAPLPPLSGMKPHLSGKAGDFLIHCRHYISKRDPYDNWAAHPSWLIAFFAFAKATAEQKSVLYHVLATDPEPRKAPLSIGDNIIGGTYVDAALGQVHRGTYVIEPILDMLSRGLLAIDPGARAIEFTESGLSLLETLKPFESDFRYREFFRAREALVEPEILPAAQAWVLDFFQKLKTITPRPAEVAAAQE